MPLNNQIAYRPYDLANVDHVSRGEEYVLISISEFASSSIDDAVILPLDEPLRVPDLQGQPLTILPLGLHPEEELADKLDAPLLDKNTSHRCSTHINKGIPTSCFDGSIFLTYNQYMLSNVPSTLYYSYAMALHGCPQDD